MSVEPLRYLSRATGGVKLVALDAGATVVAVAHNGEATATEVAVEEDADGEVVAPVDAGDAAPAVDGGRRAGTGS